MWPLAVLTGWPYYRGIFIRKCIGILPGQKKNGRINEVAVLTRWP